MLTLMQVAIAFELELDEIEDGIHWSIEGFENLPEFNGFLDHELATYYDTSLDIIDSIPIEVVEGLRRCLVTGDYVELDLFYEQDLILYQ